MRFISLIIGLMLFFGCKETKDENEIQITCERIIAQFLDSKKGVPSINFLISYKNMGEKEEVLFLNSLHKSQSEPYDSIGLTLNFQNKATPIGVFGEGSIVILKPNETKRFLYCYSPIYNNIWFFEGENKFVTREDARKLVDEISLEYHFSSTIASRLVREKKIKIDENYFYDKSTVMKIWQLPIEYRESISVEEVIDMLEGRKINKYYDTTDDVY